jgi:hypothetical protein
MRYVDRLRHAYAIEQMKLPCQQNNFPQKRSLSTQDGRSRSVGFAALSSLGGVGAAIILVENNENCYKILGNHS